MIARMGDPDSLKQLLRLLAALGYPGATPQDDLLALGLTSLELLQLDADIERQFAVPVSPELMLSAATIGELADRLAAGSSGQG